MEILHILYRSQTIRRFTLIALLLIGWSWVGPQQSCAARSSQSPKRLKILHIMSYHTPWKWTDDQLNGFKDALQDLDVEYRVFQMDTKRNSSQDWKQKVGREARELIDTRKPDLVYTNDDNAQEYVVTYYVNTDIPFIFSGVNAPPDTCGFTGSRNITGVLEVDGKSPASFAVVPTVKGEPVISLARARALGLHLHTRVLLTAQVVQEFAWED